MILKTIPEEFYERYNKCFACGKDNPYGLKLRFRPEGEVVKALFTPNELYGGWPGVIHGGILFTMLDEAMSYALIFNGILNYVTAKADLRFRNPGRVGEQVTIIGKVDKHARNLWWTSGSILRPDGTVIAESSGVMYDTGDELKLKL
jgi:acyl-coenzyme A thioesterase PaaI-like protein